jgi:hypothetical protein
VGSPLGARNGWLYKTDGHLGQTVLTGNMLQRVKLQDQVQAVQVTGCLHLAVRMRDMDSDCGHGKETSGLRDQVST